MFLRELFFSQLKDRKIEDICGKRLGIVRDIAVSFSGDVPKVVGICTNREGYFPISALVTGLASDGLTVADGTKRRELLSEEWYIAKLLLDHQVIARRDRRVHRINDLVFASYGKEKEEHIFFVGADIGIRGVLRRLGMRRFLSYREECLSGWRDMVLVDTLLAPSCFALDELGEMTANDMTEICRKLGRCDMRRFLHQVSQIFVRRASAEAERRLAVLLEELPTGLRSVLQEEMASVILPERGEKSCWRT